MLTCQPLRELQPNPASSASKTVTERPARDKVKAAQRPVYPEPIIATSRLRSIILDFREGRGVMSHQYGLVLKSPEKILTSQSSFALFIVISNNKWIPHSTINQSLAGVKV